MNDIILACLHQNPERFPDSELNTFDAKQWKTFINLAAEYRVVPLLHQRISSAALDSEIAKEALESLGIYAKEVARNNLRMYAELQQYLKALNQASIPVILLKGVYLAHQIYPGKGLREMNDMDLLFHKKDLDRAADILMQQDYQPSKPLHTEFEVKKSHHLPPMIKDQVAVFEIHWNITKPGKSYYIEPDLLWERTEVGEIMGEPVQILSPEDFLLHLCIHTSHQHMFSFGLRPFCDIAATIQYYGGTLDWDRVARIATEYGWQKGTFLALWAAKDMIGADVPETTLKDLQPEDVDAELLNISKEQVFTEKYVSASVPQPMITAFEEKNIIKKIKTVWERIFLTPEIMATRYPVKPGSIKMYAYYLVRFGEAVKRHTGKMFRIFRGDQKLTGIVERKSALHRWLNE